MLSQQIRELCDACFTGLLVRTSEDTEAIAELRILATTEGWNFLVWDSATGLNGDGNGDPMAVVQALPSIGSADKAGMIVLRNFHRYLADPQIVQTMANAIVAGKLTRSFAVITTPACDLPPELSKLFVLVEHDLPDDAALESIAKQIGTQDGDLPDDLTTVVESARGLTRYEAEGVYSLSLARHGVIRPDVVWELKAKAIARSGLARIYKGGERFDDLGGLDRLKWHARLAANPRNGLLPKGFVLVGPPGSGKSAVAKAMGNEMGLPTLIVDVGSLMGSLVGQTEDRTRQLFSLIRQIGRCVCLMDEGNLALGGGSGRHEVTDRLVGSLLSFIQDTPGPFFILTANEIASLPAPLMRAGRMDAIYFVDLPGEAQRERIWQIHLAKAGLPADSTLPNSEGMSGAEIEAVCRTAAMYGLSLEEAVAFIVPVSVSRAGELEALRQEAARNGWLSAERSGPYTRQSQQAGNTVRRQVSRPGTSSN